MDNPKTKDTRHRTKKNSTPLISESLLFHEYMQQILVSNIVLSLSHCTCDISEEISYRCVGIPYTALYMYIATLFAILLF